MKKALFILMTITLSGFIAVKAAVFANGVDVGWLSQMESSGRKFYNSAGVQQDCLQILKDLCVNSIRLRVWVNPTGGWCGKADVVAMAVRAHNMGFSVMLDFHYSDSWADPGKQNKPAAWTGYTFPQLVQAVHDHTNDVLSAVVAAGVIPEWVQVGNETNNGMLWDATAAISGRATDSMSNFAQLVTSGYNAVKAVNSSIKVIVHISNGYDNALFRWIFDGLKNNGGLWDIMGMSLYPDATNTYTTWDPQCLTNMNDMVSRYPGKQVMISEFGYDVTQAQTTHDFAVDLITKVKSVTGNNGLGVFYWEPECYNGWQGYNKGAFDNTGKPTIAMNAFAENCVAVTATATAVTPVLTASPSATQTRTRTSTVTPTRTQTTGTTLTYTRTPAVTPIYSPTRTRTAAGTPTRTRTIAGTPTRTRTYTRTPAPTRTVTTGVIYTYTATQTRTMAVTPAATFVLTPTVTPTSGQAILRVQYYTSNTSTDSNTLYVNARVYNDAASPMDLLPVSVKYWYTFEGAGNIETAELDYAGIQPGGQNIVPYVNRNIQTISQGGQTRVETTSFSSAAGSIPAGGYVELRLRIHKNDWTNYTQTNDYSFGTQTAYQDWVNVTAYISGAKVWGTEPGAVAASAISKTTKTPDDAAFNPGNVYAFPNPASSGVTIRFYTDGTAEVRILVADVNGRKIQEMNINPAGLKAGKNYIRWNLKNQAGADVSNGVYLLYIKSGTALVVKKLAIVR